MKNNSKTMQCHHIKVALIAAGTLVLAGIPFAMATEMKPKSNTFGSDAEFLQKHTDAVVLRRGKAAVVVVPEYQGRVMTATARGDEGASSGWINYKLVQQGVLPAPQAAGKLDEHMYAFGGEERFWMGPEGGQYSIFFAPGTPFKFPHWFTPAPIDHDHWQVAKKTGDQITFKHDFDLQNHSATRFKVGVERSVELLDAKSIAKLLGTKVPGGVDAVAYRTVNSVTNKGSEAWEPGSGLLSIWLLSMFQPSPTTTVFIPYHSGDAATLGPVVNADYFGAVPPSRLKTDSGVIYFKCDGTQRGKIGVGPHRSSGMAGSYDPVAGRLTLLIYEQPKKFFGYVNSMWELQKEPFKGDAVNSYNDGPVDESGEQMGPFYELESSSPALALKPGKTGTHTQTILHLYGSEDQLQKVLSSVSNVSLNQVAGIFQSGKNGK